jgi:hypothetical protein
LGIYYTRKSSRSLVVKTCCWFRFPPSKEIKFCEILLKLWLFMMIYFPIIYIIYIIWLVVF